MKKQISIGHKSAIIMWTRNNQRTDLPGLGWVGQGHVFLDHVSLLGHVSLGHVSLLTSMLKLPGPREVEAKYS